MADAGVTGVTPSGSPLDGFSLLFVPVLRYGVLIPLHYIFMIALPWLALTIYTALYYVLSTLSTVLLYALWPVLLPLKLLLVRPALATFSMLYSVRHVIYFVSFAALLGAGMGLVPVALNKLAVGSSRSEESVRSKRRRRKDAVLREESSTRAFSKSQAATSTDIPSSSSSSPLDADIKSWRNAALIPSTQPNAPSSGDNDKFRMAMNALANRRRGYMAAG